MRIEKDGTGMADAFDGFDAKGFGETLPTIEQIEPEFRQVETK